LTFVPQWLLIVFHLNIELYDILDLIIDFKIYIKKYEILKRFFNNKLNNKLNFDLIKQYDEKIFKGKADKQNKKLNCRVF